MTLGVGLTHSINNFGHIPDPPEPESDEWFEEHCPKCRFNREYKDDNEWYSYCTMGSCVGFVEREDEDGSSEN